MFITGRYADALGELRGLLAQIPQNTPAHAALAERTAEAALEAGERAYAISLLKPIEEHDGNDCSAITSPRPGLCRGRKRSGARRRDQRAHRASQQGPQFFRGEARRFSARTVCPEGWRGSRNSGCCAALGAAQHLSSFRRYRRFRTRRSSPSTLTATTLTRFTSGKFIPIWRPRAIDGIPSMPSNQIQLGRDGKIDHGAHSVLRREAELRRRAGRTHRRHRGARRKRIPIAGHCNRGEPGSNRPAPEETPRMLLFRHARAFPGRMPVRFEPHAPGFSTDFFAICQRC